MRLHWLLIPLLAAFCWQPLKAQSLPQNWVGMFAGYSGKGDGSVCAAVLVSQSAQAYSYSCYHAVVQRNSVPATTLQTGAALLLRSFGPLSLYGLGTGGTATNGTAVTAAFSGGGLLMWSLKSGLTFQLGMQMDRINNVSTPDYQIGVGYRFSK
jgi:hypothetical protein